MKNKKRFNCNCIFYWENFLWTISRICNIPFQIQKHFNRFTSLVLLMFSWKKYFKQLKAFLTQYTKTYVSPKENCPLVDCLCSSHLTLFGNLHRGSTCFEIYREISCFGISPLLLKPVFSIGAHPWRKTPRVCHFFLNSWSNMTR